MKPVRYWDSCAFLRWFLDDPATKKECGEVLRAAKNGDFVIATSAITLTEVIKIAGSPRLPRDIEKRLRLFFMHDWISIRNVDRTIAEVARDLVWQYPSLLKPKDSIHVATAIHFGIPLLETYDDKDLIPLDGKIGSPALKIAHPRVDQGLLFDIDVTEEEVEGEENEASREESN